MSLHPPTAFSKRDRVKPRRTRDPEHCARVAALGCCICGVAAEVHHVRVQTGIGRRPSDHDTIPLCPAHHRTGGYGVALHAGVGAWEMTFGRQSAWLEWTREQLK